MTLFEMHPLPWKAIDAGDGKTSVMDAGNCYVFCGNRDMTYARWSELLEVVNDLPAHLYKGVDR